MRPNCPDRVEECVVQFHPAKADYVNYHPATLHLWKPVGVPIPKPPPERVGPFAAAAG